MTFPILTRIIGASVFLIFALVCAALAGFLKIYMPETRGEDTAIVASKVANGFKSKPLEYASERINDHENDEI